MPTEGERRAFLDRVVPELARLEREGAEAYWQATTGGGADAEARYAAIRAETARRLSDGAEYAFLAEADAAPTRDPVLDRQITLLRLAYQGYQADPKLLEDIVAREAELEGIFTRFRADLDGPRQVNARVRSSGAEIPAEIRPAPDGGVGVAFHQPARAVTPGQAIVFYDGDDVVGGAVIDRVGA